jgi:hypothetical protein
MVKILSRDLQAVADRGRHLDGSFPYKGTAYRGVYCSYAKAEAYL